MRKDGELFVRGVFDLWVRRKPQAFSADAAVSLWILNPSLLIINELELSNAMPRWRTYSAHTASVRHNAASAAPAASFLPPTRLQPGFGCSQGPPQAPIGVLYGLATTDQQPHLVS
jgi:hypothetical protein